MTLFDRFMKYVSPEPNTGCWLWLGGENRGYGVMWTNGPEQYAHRIGYQLFRGAIPEGMELDHLCRVRCCVNPNHLEAVSGSENVKRSPLHRGSLNLNKTHCKRGHAFDEANTRITVKGYRACRACLRLWARDHYQGRKCNTTTRKLLSGPYFVANS